jgi:hypothetical protein
MAGLAILTPSLAFAQQDRVSSTEKGSLLIFSKVEIRWDATGSLIQDTFIDISNDYPEDVRVLMYFVNGDDELDKCDKVDLKDEDDPAVCDDGDKARRHPGWNWVDNEIMLTKNQPAYWSAATGLPFGVSPFTVLDPGPANAPGRPDPEGTGERVLRGMVYAWAINADGEEIRWNHLKGDATIVNYLENSAWEYNAWSFQVVAGVANGAQTGDPGTLNLDGAEYGLGFDQLLMDFYAAGSMPFNTAGPGPQAGVTNVDTDLTLHPISLDARQESDGPITTKAHFDVWNEDEVKFSGAYRCITCWDQWLLSRHGIPNHFAVNNLGTNKGKARIDGLQSQLCDVEKDPKDMIPFGENPEDIVSEAASLLGVVAKVISFSNGATARAGTNLHGLGTQDGLIQYDLLGAPPEATAPGDVLQEGIDSATKALSGSKPTSKR